MRCLNGDQGGFPELTPLNSYENRVYQFQDEDRRRVLSLGFIV